MMPRASMLRIAVVALVAIGIALNAGTERQTPETVSEPIARPTTAGSAPVPQAGQSPTRAVPPKPASDPFAPRAWKQPTPAPAVAPPPVVQPAVVEPVVTAPPPPVVPSLPYSFMGKFEDGGRLVVYLRRGEQTYVVTAGETIESSYKVLKVDANQVEFEHLSSGTQQVLTIPAANN